jgi:nucleoside-diphosphate-sugar epimerase
MKIFITGIAGFIGSHLAERLVEDGHTVYGIDSFLPYYDRSLKEVNISSFKSKNVEVIEGDLMNADLSNILTKDVDIIFHCAAQPGISDKVSFEQLVLSYNREKGLKACSVRPFSIYGERERPDKMCYKLIEALLDDKEFPLFDGSTRHRRSFTYVGDLVDGLVSIMSHLDEVNGKIFNIGNPISVTVGDVIDTIEKTVGKKAKFVIKPKRSGDQDETRAVIDKAQTILGFQAKTPLNEGIRKQVLWHQGRRK